VTIELDDVDIGILAFLSDIPDSSTTDIARALFTPPYNIRRLDSFIRYRVKRFVEEGIITQIKRSRKLYYSVDTEKVLFGDVTLNMEGVGEIDIGFYIVVKLKDGAIAKNLDEYEKRIGAKKIFAEQ